MSEETEKKEKIVFNNVKNSLNQSELNALIFLAEKSYNTVNSALKSRKKALDELSISAPKDAGIEDLVKKISEKLADKLDNIAVQEFGNELANINNVISFLNIFRMSDDQIEYMNDEIIIKARKYVKENI